MASEDYPVFEPENYHDELPTNGEELYYKQRGVLYIEHIPIYIVEVHRLDGLVYAYVYDVEDREAQYPTKKLREDGKVSRTKRFLDTTRLSKFMEFITNDKEKKTDPVRTEYPPLFVTPVLPDQLCSLTNKIQSAFYEREQDRPDTSYGNTSGKMIKGRPTGVVIGLDAIVWEPARADPMSVVRSYQGQGEMPYYDFQKPSSDQEHPLIQYYENLTDGEDQNT